MDDDKQHSSESPRNAVAWLRQCHQTLKQETLKQRSLKQEPKDWDFLTPLAQPFAELPDDAGAAAQKVLRLVDAYETGHRALSLTPHESRGSEMLRNVLLKSLDQLATAEQRRRTYAAFIGCSGASALLIGTIIWIHGALRANPSPVLWWGVAIAVLGVIVTSLGVLRATRPGRLWGLAPAVTLVATVTLVVIIVVILTPRQPADVILGSAGALTLVAVAAGIVIYGVASASRDADLPLRSFGRLLISGAIHTPLSPRGVPELGDVDLFAPATARSEQSAVQEGAERDVSRLIDWIGIETELRADEEGRRSRRWQWTHYLLGAGAAAAAGAAGVTFTRGTSGAFEYVVLFGAFLAAILSGVVTAVNPGRMWEEARTAHRTFEALRRQITIMQQIYVPTYNLQRCREALDYVLQRFEQIAGTREHETFWRRSQGT